MAYWGDCMSKRLLTPLGEIQIYIDGVCSNYEYEKYSKDILALQEQPVDGSYRIIISKTIGSAFTVLCHFMTPRYPITKILESGICVLVS